METNARMYWTIMIVAVAAVAVSSAGCTSQTTQSPTPGIPASFLLYTNKNAGVQINYPSDWQLTGSPSVGIALWQHGNDTVLFRISSTQTKQTAQSIAQSMVKDVQQNYSNVSVLENHSASLGGLPGYKTVTSFKSGNQTYKALTVITIKSNQLYLIQFSGVAAQYDEQNATAQQMISSFKFT
ncbi:MAG: PsbP-related protein [Halobacteriota archaeon]